MTATMAAAPTIDYYLTPVSPFAYFGHGRLRAIAAAHGATIRLLPADFGRVFAASGGLPLAQRPKQRQAYRLVELERWRRHLGMPLNLHPRHFPVDAGLASRWIIAALAQSGTEVALDLTGRILESVWVHEGNVADATCLRALAADCGCDASIADAAASPEVADSLMANTEAAIAAGAFGAPWFVLDGEPFWGQDRLDLLDAALAARR